jgi:hypothetical protein
LVDTIKPVEMGPTAGKVKAMNIMMPFMVDHWLLATIVQFPGPFFSSRKTADDAIAPAQVRGTECHKVRIHPNPVGPGDVTKVPIFPV